MNIGQCLLSFIPVRAEASDRSELVTQLIYGETYAVLETFDKWLKIEIHGDNYVGYIDKKQFNEKVFSTSEAAVNTQFPRLIQSSSRTVYAPIGAYIQETPKPNLHLNDAIERLKSFLGAPYVWGGKTNFGYDCSGFTQIFYRLLGVSLLRDAYQQATQGATIHLLDEAVTGDLAFFDNADGKITHVGIVLKSAETFEIFHSSGELRIDQLDHQGIYKKNEGYSHNLRLIQRVL